MSIRTATEVCPGVALDDRVADRICDILAMAADARNDSDEFSSGVREGLRQASSIITRMRAPRPGGVGNTVRWGSRGWAFVIDNPATYC